MKKLAIDELNMVSGGTVRDIFHALSYAVVRPYAARAHHIFKGGAGRVVNNSPRYRFN